MSTKRYLPLLVVFVGICVFAAARLSAPPWPDRLPDVRLEPTRPILGPDQVTPDNAFYLVRQLTNFDTVPHLGDATNEYQQFKAMGWSEGACTQMESIAAGRAQAFDLFREAGKMPRCQVVSMTSVTSVAPWVGSVLGESRAMCFDGEWAACRGDWKTAEEDFCAVLRVCDHLTRGGAMIHCLCGYAGMSTACYGIRRIAVQQDPPGWFLRDMTAALLDIDLHMEPIADAMRYERMLGQDSIRLVRGGTLPDLNASSRPTRVLKVLGRSGLLSRTPAHFDAVYSHIIALASAPYAANDSFENVVPPASDSNHFRQVGILLDDPIGRLLISILVPAIDQYKKQYVATHAVLRGSAIFLAVRAYQIDHHGGPPSSLSELVPAYLDHLPEDPFGPNHETFAYTASDTGWNVYSVGPDQKDDQGLYDWTRYDERTNHSDRLDVCFSSTRFEKDRDEYLRRNVR